MSVESRGSGGQIRFTAVPSAGDFTICFWFKPVSLATGLDGYLTGGNFWGIWKEGPTTDQVVFLSNAEAGTNLIVVTENAWHFFALVHDDSATGTEFSCYAMQEGDGAFSAALGLSGTVNVTDDMHFCRSPFGELASGDYVNAKIFDVAMTDEELWLEAQILRPSRIENLWSWLQCSSEFDTTDGTITGAMRDYSGNGNHGPVSGASFFPIDDVLGNNIPLVPWGESGILVPPAASQAPEPSVNLRHNDVANRHNRLALRHRDSTLRHRRSTIEHNG